VLDIDYLGAPGVPVTVFEHAHPDRLVAIGDIGQPNQELSIFAHLTPSFSAVLASGWSVLPMYTVRCRPPRRR
jgi:hypothetical protein